MNFRSDMISAGLKENSVTTALYHAQEDGDINVMMVTHLDDIMWGSKPGNEHMVAGLLAKYEFNSVETQSFRLCGREAEQHEDGSVVAMCRSTPSDVEPINFRRRPQSDDATHAEIAQRCSVFGPVGWVARYCRPGLSCKASRVQTVVRQLQVKNLIDANRILLDCVVGSDRGPRYPSGQLSSADMTWAASCDASFAGEAATDHRQKEPHRYQRGCQLFSSERLAEGQFPMHLISFSSNVSCRFCRSTMAAETYAHTSQC